MIFLLFWALAPAAEPSLSYYKDVEPLLQRHCQQCHREGEAAPMPLVTYKQVRPWARAVKEAVLSRRMPPWHADPAVGHYSNARVMTAAEIAIVRQWVDTGAKEGDARQAPPPRRFADGWQISKPDLVLEMPEEAEVALSGQMEYVHYIVPTNFKEDRWVSEMEVRPGNRAVVHHIGVYLRPKGSQWMSEGKPGEGFQRKSRISGRTPMDELFAQYVTGGQAQILPDGMARLIPAGSDLIFQLHYQPNGKPAKDRSRIGLVFAKTPPVERVHTIGVAEARFVIPPRDPAYEVRALWRIHKPVRLFNVTPHIHLRGKSFECSAALPDQSAVTPLVRVPHWDRNWQITYEFADPLKLPAGTRIHCLAVFDNSANNPVNPNPDVEVRWGDQTTDEMMVAYMDLAFPAEWPLLNLYRREPLPVQ